SEERKDSNGFKTWPDIDIDLPSGDQREKVIQHVYQRFGASGAAMTANVITYRARSSSREIGKVLGMPESELDRMSKLLPYFEFKSDQDTLDARAAEAGFAIGDRRVRLYLDLCSQIEGLPRHLGQHSGGMVIAQGRLDQIVPLEPASMPGRTVVQWDKDDCADLGIIKVDLLGLGMMAVLEQAVPLVRTHEGVEVDLAQLPAGDPLVYSMLQAADTVGVFQVESRAQMATLPRMKPTAFYDIVVEVAIIRPGPIVGQMVSPYLERRMGRQPVTYPDPRLEHILKRTLGVPLFQEQLMRISMEAAGFSGGEADELRRAMGSKRSVEKMKQMESRLRDGMTRNGIPQKGQDEIVRGIQSFALYGFPESHAASFALIVYASAYLRAHHPQAFLCAMLNCYPMGFYSPATLVKDAQRHGVRVLPIDVTRSEWLCTLERKEAEGELCVRLGLRYVAGFRQPVAQALVDERLRARFASIGDLAARVSMKREELTTLAEIGALAGLPMHKGDRVNPTRRAALWQAEAMIRRGPGLLAELEGEEAEMANGRRWGDAWSDVRADAERSVPKEGVPRGSQPRGSELQGGELQGGEPQGSEPRGGEQVAQSPYAPSPSEGAAEALRAAEFFDDAARRFSQASRYTPALTEPFEQLHGHPREQTKQAMRAFAHEAQQQGPRPPAPQPAHEPDTPRPPGSHAEPRRSSHAEPRTAARVPTGQAEELSPLPEMTALERTAADLRGTGLTVGRHPVAHLRDKLSKGRVVTAREVKSTPSGRRIRVGGLCIVRQRPGTAKGFVFLSLEDETGIANVIIEPEVYEQNRKIVLSSALLVVEGRLEARDGTFNVKGDRFWALHGIGADTQGRDFH
ncbi:MAG: hypothetical protein JST92_11320, partial [Deltaproteobacteria bacterium]|nr:hypothetical protein [Deltaproteobacteria bacterium]